MPKLNPAFNILLAHLKREAEYEKQQAKQWLEKYNSTEQRIREIQESREP